MAACFLLLQILEMFFTLYFLFNPLFDEKVTQLIRKFSTRKFSCSVYYSFASFNFLVP